MGALRGYGATTERVETGTCDCMDDVAHDFAILGGVGALVDDIETCV